MQNDKYLYKLVVKKDCPTCQLILPVVQELSNRFGEQLSVFVQDEMDFFASSANCIDDGSLEFSYRNNIEIVPTLVKFDGDSEVDRVYGWVKQEWAQLCGIENLAQELPERRPGCGSLSVDPNNIEKLQLQFGDHGLSSRQFISNEEDAEELCYERGWTDGLPVVPPTPARVLRMLGTVEGKPGDIIGAIPPNYAECSLEKLAINAVMAGCKPEYFPVVLATVVAALQDEFCLHGLLCTTYFSSPVVIVNGPVAKKIGMNGGNNALGQGNRANATIGRALQLLVRNVGDGRPGEIDRATLGNPGKYTFCFAEDESDTDWPTLAQDQGFSREQSAVSVFAGDGVQAIVDQRSRTAESLIKSLAQSLKVVAHSKLWGMADAILVVSPEHRRVLRESGCSKAQFREQLMRELSAPGSELIRGAQGIAEGMPEALKDKTLTKFREGGLHIVSAGGTAGLFSAIISGWVATGKMGSSLVTRAIDS